MNESLVVEMWDLIKEYADKKQLSVIAEKYLNVLSDHGVREQDLESALGHDDDLDDAIKELLEIDDEVDYDEDDDE
jgi:poly-D-alanine transfer protein DltD